MKTQKMKTAFLSFLFILPVALSAQISYGEIRGVIKNAELEPIPFATVKILQGTQLIGGTQSDEKGQYKYKPLVPGYYEMVVMNPEYMTQQINKITVNEGAATYIDVKLNVNTLTTITVVAKPIDYTPPGVNSDMYKLESVSGEELRQNASYNSGNINSAIVAMTSDALEDSKGEIHFRGSRTGSSSYYVDGVRTFGETFIPGVAIENLTVFSGGVPACYGDMTSGMVMITTKSYFSGIREKNMRNTEYKERKEEEKRTKQAKEDEEKRLKEIEEEKAKEKSERK